eukprot:CAMPEP_0168799998 /NCGR_PEP_ID=MMETSP0725-20121227/18761_1 /TAXON_ID=265536 /ORGANISM="Amphiprora sp., Strain CCMP467" /LENGTH=132 /DNA_ID=CAMNT_0008851565 /DNA_START=82 /DNA_END=480 /DNA_ORIENTATION=-
MPFFSFVPTAPEGVGAAAFLAPAAAGAACSGAAAPLAPGGFTGTDLLAFHPLTTFCAASRSRLLARLLISSAALAEMRFPVCAFSTTRAGMSTTLKSLVIWFFKSTVPVGMAKNGKRLYKSLNSNMVRSALT